MAAHTLTMSNEQWWSKLGPETRAWLIDNNGDAVPEGVAAEVAAAGGPLPQGNADDDAPPGRYYTDEVVDWVEEMANDEDPQGSGLAEGRTVTRSAPTNPE